MAEYAMVTAAVALLAVSLIGAVGKTPTELPRSTAAALQLVNSSAKAKHVAVGDARAAFQRAPFGKPALKYIYAVGWITGTKNRESCLYSGSPSDSITEATREISANKKVTSKLRSRGVTPRQAGTALVKGIVAACND